jgi:hypothetical protein
MESVTWAKEGELDIGGSFPVEQQDPIIAPVVARSLEDFYMRKSY